MVTPETRDRDGPPKWSMNEKTMIEAMERLTRTIVWILTGWCGQDAAHRAGAEIRTAWKKAVKGEGEG